MPWWEKFGLGKSGLSKKDIEMMEGQSSPDDFEYLLHAEMESKNTYGYPLPKLDDALALGSELAKRPPEVKQERLREVGGFLVEDSPESHQLASSKAIDFLIPDGTTVLAAADGTIIEVIEDNDKWGPTKENANFQNRITILHENNEYSQYVHLAKGSFTEMIQEHGYDEQPRFDRFGNKTRRFDIKAGDPIARVGKTGWTDRDHLHFMVFRMLTPDEQLRRKDQSINWISLKPRFLE